MGTFGLTIETDSAAFDDAPASELSRILRDLASRIEDGDFPVKVYDANGNAVGVVSYAHTVDAREARKATEAATLAATYPPAAAVQAAAAAVIATFTAWGAADDDWPEPQRTHIRDLRAALAALGKGA